MTKNNVSDASDSFKFTLVAQGKEQEMLLEVDDTELQGNVVEVIGRTEPGAALIINGEQVADIQPGRPFPLFHRNRWRGAAMKIVITGQNRRGRNGDQAGGGCDSVATKIASEAQRAAAAAPKRDPGEKQS